MIEVTGNLWTYPADYRVITTNGTLKANGAVVMGRGCAREARNAFPGIDKSLGRLIRLFGNTVLLLPHKLISFPVKHNWWEQADIDLIRQSAHRLQHIAIELGGGTFVLPRPGCGNGGLKWADVKPEIEPFLDDSFHVITFAAREN